MYIRGNDDTPPTSSLDAWRRWLRAANLEYIHVLNTDRGVVRPYWTAHQVALSMAIRTTGKQKLSDFTQLNLCKPITGICLFLHAAQALKHAFVHLKELRVEGRDQFRAHCRHGDKSRRGRIPSQQLGKHERHRALGPARLQTAVKLTKDFAKKARLKRLVINGNTLEGQI